MKITPLNKFFGAVFAFIVMIFAVAQIWFPDMFEMDDFAKFAGTVAVIYLFVAAFAFLTSDKKSDKNGETDDKNS